MQSSKPKRKGAIKKSALLIILSVIISVAIIMLVSLSPTIEEETKSAIIAIVLLVFFVFLLVVSIYGVVNGIKEHKEKKIQTAKDKQLQSAISQEKKQIHLKTMPEHFQSM